MHKIICVYVYVLLVDRQRSYMRAYVCLTYMRVCVCLTCSQEAPLLAEKGSCEGKSICMSDLYTCLYMCVFICLTCSQEAPLLVEKGSCEVLHT